MRVIHFLIFLIAFATSYGQENRSQLAECTIFHSGTYVDGENRHASISVRNVEKDTVIDGLRFQKYRVSEFTDYAKERQERFFFETYENGKYIKLDGSLQPIHRLDFGKKEQQGILFGQEDDILLVYEDTRRHFPRDSLVADERTPKKFHSAHHTERYIVLSTDLKSNQLEMDDGLYTRHLLGDNIYRISQNMDNAPINNRIDNRVGDEVQLVYRRKWYDEVTGQTEYEDKQFKNFKYVGDTLIAGQKALLMETDGYSFLSGSEEQQTRFPVVLTEAGYQMDGMEVPVKEYGAELKITDNNSLLLQAVYQSTIGGEDFPVVVRYDTDGPYTANILGSFPLTFYEVGNVEGFISYAKIKGREYGRKRERTFKKDHTTMWGFHQAGNQQVKVRFFVLEKADIRIQLGTDGDYTDIFKEQLDAGKYEYTLDTETLERGTYYNLRFGFETENGSGMQTDGFYAK